MEMATMSWTFGDPTGWMVGGLFFGFFSLVLGGLVYEVSFRLASMGSLDEPRQASRRPSVVLGCLMAMGTFSALYVTSLSGFSQLEFRNGHLTIHYMLPERTVVLPFIEVMHVQEEPAFKGQWRLVLTTETSGTYESALASQSDVHKAGEFLRQQRAQQYSVQQDPLISDGVAHVSPLN
jgi:amino acid transporter